MKLFLLLLLSSFATVATSASPVTIMETDFNGATMSGMQLTDVTWSQSKSMKGVVKPNKNIIPLGLYKLRNDLSQWKGNVAVDYNLNKSDKTVKGLAFSFSVTGEKSINLSEIVIGHTHTTNSGSLQIYESDMMVTITDRTNKSVLWSGRKKYEYKPYWKTSAYTVSSVKLQPGHEYIVSLSMSNLDGGGAYATWNLIKLVSGGSSRRLIHHWKFEDNLDDEVGGVNGVYTGSRERYVKGRIGKALKLNNVDYASATPINFGSENADFSISTWVKIPVKPDENDRMFSFGKDRFGLHIDTDLKIRLYMCVGIATDPEIITLNNWHHISLVKDSESVHIYVDGVEKVCRKRRGNWAGAETLTIGSRGVRDPRQFINGLMDEVKVFSYALSKEEVEAEFDSVNNLDIGLKVVRDGVKISWTAADESMVKKFLVVNTVTGEVLETMIACGDFYETTVPEGVNVTVQTVPK